MRHTDAVPRLVCPQQVHERTQHPQGREGGHHTPGAPAGFHRRRHQVPLPAHGRAGGAGRADAVAAGRLGRAAAAGAGGGEGVGSVAQAEHADRIQARLQAVAATRPRLAVAGTVAVTAPQLAAPVAARHGHPRVASQAGWRRRRGGQCRCGHGHGLGDAADGRRAGRPGWRLWFGRPGVDGWYSR